MPEGVKGFTPSVTPFCCRYGGVVHTDHSVVSTSSAGQLQTHSVPTTRFSSHRALFGLKCVALGHNLWMNFHTVPARL